MHVAARDKLIRNYREVAPTVGCLYVVLPEAEPVHLPQGGLLWKDHGDSESAIDGELGSEEYVRILLK
jgi:hypothetical protein